MKPFLLSILSVLSMACASCHPAPTVKICAILNQPNAECNEGSKHTTPAFPEGMKNYVAFDDVALLLFVSRKDECLADPNHTIHSGSHNTLREMNPCVIDPTLSLITPMPICNNSTLSNYYAVDRLSWSKMRNFMSYCGESTN
jgi:hypothetical protein